MDLKRIKTYKLFVIGMFFCSCLLGCKQKKEIDTTKSISIQTIQNKTEKEQKKVQKDVSDKQKEEPVFIHADGEILKDRILPPKAYKRIKAKSGSFLEFLRNYKLKPDKSSVMLYNGQEKGNQNAHIAVFDLPLENEDLQQCADSIMRLYAEYFWSNNQHDRISFQFVNGFKADYSKWKAGYRIKINGNNVSWVKSSSYDDSYETFCKYLRIVFAYAGTLSMEKESKKIDLSKLRAGDVFLRGASPGHVVMVLDICEDKEGNKAFLLGQGYMPAQDFHVLKNPNDEVDPWYYEKDISYPFTTPEYTFGEGSLKRLGY